MGKWSQLYTSRRWRTLRENKLIYDPFCWYCLQVERYTAADTVDHIEQHDGDMKLFFDWDNLRSSCKACHDSAAQLKDKHGFVPGVGSDGVPIDPNHPWNSR